MFRSRSCQQASKRDMKITKGPRKGKFIRLVWLGRSPGWWKKGFLFGSADGADTSHWEHGQNRWWVHSGLASRYGEIMRFDDIDHFQVWLLNSIRDLWRMCSILLTGHHFNLQSRQSMVCYGLLSPSSACFFPLTAWSMASPATDLIFCFRSRTSWRTRLRNNWPAQRAKPNYGIDIVGC